MDAEYQGKIVPGIICALLFAPFLLPAASPETVPEAWRIPEIMKRNYTVFFSARWTDSAFWKDLVAPGVFREKTELPEDYQRLGKLDFFKNAALTYLCSGNFRRFISGAELIRADQLMHPKQAAYADSPRKAAFPFLVDYSGNRTLPGKMLGEDFRHDIPAYRKWLETHPNFYGFRLSEWDNETVGFEYFLNLARKRKIITDAEYAGMKKRFPPAGDRNEMLARTRKMYDLLRKLYFNDPDHLVSMHAGWNFGHMAAAWGVRSIMLETTNTSHGNSYYRWQSSMFFIRGAARQFGIPWGWYLASFFNGPDAEGKWRNNSEVKYVSRGGKYQGMTGPDCGMSLSLRKRGTWLAWLSGASFFERENWLGSYLEWDWDKVNSVRLSPEGEFVVNFHTLTKRIDRGVPYTPVALLIPFNQGYPATGGKSWRCFAYTPGDFMIDAWLATVIPAYARPEALKRGEEGCLFNSPFGDGFDVLAPDVPGRNDFYNTLRNYPAAVLLGDYKPSQTLRTDLERYAAEGGTLILADEHRKLGISESGKGKILTLPADFLPPFHSGTLDGTMRGEIRFPKIGALLEKLLKKLLPVTVSGDIQYGLNRTRKGWLVYLINNRGVTKYADSAEKINPAAETEIRIKPNGFTFREAFERIGNRRLSLRNGTVTLRVESGGVRLVELNS